MLVPTSYDSKSRDREDIISSMEISIIRFPNNLNKFHLVNSYLKLRKHIFIDGMGWPLCHDKDIEFEQYDRLDTTYIIAHVGDEVLGGGRLRRTDQTNGEGTCIYSYMVRDACLGLLKGLPEDLCTELPPMRPDVWELSRLVVNEPGRVVGVLLSAINRYLFSQHASDCICLGSPAFMRVAKRIGWKVKAMGPLTGNDDGKFLAFSCKVTDPQIMSAKSISTAFAGKREIVQ